MKQLIASFLIIVGAAVFSQPLSANTQVKLIDGKKFTDYELSNQSRKRSLTTLEKDFNKLFTKLSKKYLKEGQSVSIEVTNLDLAGDIRYNTGATNQDLRIVKDSSLLKLYFNYKVLAKDGSLVTEGEHKIKEFLHLSSHSQRQKHRGNLSHFVPFLEKWFKDGFSQK